MQDIVIYIFTIFIAFLIGSISPAIQISKLKDVDIMKEGSGNAGATNVVRVLGLKFGLCVFILDFLKGFLVTFIILLIFGTTASYIASVVVVIGHIFSIFHRFKAGKGVASSIGTVFAIDWRLALIALIFGLILVLLTRRVSIGSISAAVILPILSWFLTPSYLICSILIAILILFSHRQNIIRLYKGEEKPLF